MCDSRDSVAPGLNNLCKPTRSNNKKSSQRFANCLIFSDPGEAGEYRCN